MEGYSVDVALRFFGFGPPFIQPMAAEPRKSRYCRRSRRRRCRATFRRPAGVAGQRTASRSPAPPLPYLLACRYAFRSFRLILPSCSPPLLAVSILAKVRSSILAMIIAAFA